MKYVVANWKMNMDMPQMVSWFDNYQSISKNFSFTNVSPIIAPSYIHIPYAFLEREKHLNFEIASQDISHNGKGSHTGEIGAFQVRDFCKFCVIGHSEREEPVDLVIQKRDRALEQGLIPIICFVSVDNALKYYKDGVILAWEDPANISGGGDYNEKPIAEISQGVSNLKEKLPKGAILLYGGSVNLENINDLVDLTQLDGVLVGKASLDPNHFFALVKAYEISRP